jgi:ribokinase
MKKQPRIVVLGSLLYDCVIWGPRFPQKGETIIGTKSGFFAGGKGANQVVQAAKLEAESFMIGAVGNDDNGKFLLSSLSSIGVHTSFIKIHPSLQTGMDCIHVDCNGDNKIMIVPFANLGIDTTDIDKALPVIKTADIFMTQLEINLSAVEYGLYLAKQNGIMTILNPAPAMAINPAVFANADFITPNETETQFFTDVLPVAEKPETCQHAVSQFKKQGAKNVVITLGVKGAYYALENGECGLVPSFPVKAVDSTAAGDSFNGALAVALARGERFIQAVRFGCAAGAVAVTKAGAQVAMGTNSEIAGFFEENEAFPKLQFLGKQP